MKLTKYAHACVVLEKDGRTLVIDAGGYTPTTEQHLQDADALLITHNHPDHFDKDKLVAALGARPELRVWAPSEVTAQLGHSDRVTAVRHGDTFEAAGFAVAVQGEKHAEIHRDIPLIDNVGFLIDSKLYHPGDSYFVPETTVDTLLVPTSGPWAKMGDGVDFVRAVNPRVAIQIHELLLSDAGQNFAADLMGQDGLTKSPFSILAVGDSVEV